MSAIAAAIIAERCVSPRQRAVHHIVRLCTVGTMVQAKDTATLEDMTHGYISALSLLGVTSHEIQEALTTEDLLYAEGAI